jgi:hypothetical protein
VPPHGRAEVYDDRGATCVDFVGKRVLVASLLQSTFICPGGRNENCVSAKGAFTHSTSGSYELVTFTGCGTFSTNSDRALSYLVVGGGGGGGTNGGGGGGGGGVLDGTATFVAGTTYTVDVGQGGVASIMRDDGIKITQTVGGDSRIRGTGLTTITAKGGGYGGDRDNIGRSASSGGSGGGGGAGPASGRTRGGAGTSGQGNAGGDAVDALFDSAGGGGGGQGSVGGSASLRVAGIGGSAYTWPINELSYGGGGGGGAIRGAAASGGTNAGNGAVSSTAAGGDAAANFGGGGGGSGATGDSFRGGNGGSGVVIIAIPI